MTTLNVRYAAPVVKRLLIGPAEATEMLKTARINRAVSRNEVEKMTRDIVEGRWRETHQGIAFDVDGHLIDGQHRLRAIVAAKRGVWLWIAFGQPYEAQEAVDTGRRRTVRDQLAIEGHSFSTIEVAIARRMITGNRAVSASDAEVRSALSTHLKVITSAASLINSAPRGIRTAAVATPIARAMYTHPEDEIREYAGVLVSGESSRPHHKAIILLRNRLLVTGRFPGGESASRIMYGLARRALLAFLSRETLHVLKEAEEEPFPLPDEERA